MADQPATDVVYAGFWRRFGAYIVDNLILSVAFYALVIPIVILAALGGYPVGEDDDAVPLDVLTLVLFLLYCVGAALYYSLQESSSYQATLGKRAVGIKVTDAEGNRLSRGQAFGRWFAALLSYITLYIGFLLAAFTRRKQALHDMVAETLVVDRWAYTDMPERQQRHIGLLPILLVLILMIVPFAGILLAIAIPAYQDYTHRARVATVVDGTATLQSLILAGRSDGLCPENGEAGVGAPEAYASLYVERIDVGTITDTGNCGMQITLQDGSDDLDGKRIWVEYDAEAEAWACSSEIPDRSLPRSCQG